MNMVKRAVKNLIETVIFSSVVVGGAIGFLLIIGAASIWVQEQE